VNGRRTVPPAGDLDLAALRVTAVVRLASAVAAAGYGWAVRDSVDGRTTMLFVLAGLVAVPWAALLLWASTLRVGPLPGRAARLVVQGGPVGDVLLVFAGQCLLPSAGGVLLLGHVLVICLAVTLWPERDAWILAGLCVGLTVLAQPLVPVHQRIPGFTVALFGMVLAGLVVVVDRIVRGHRLAAATSTRFREKADAILSRVADSIVVTDGRGVVTECNPAGARLIGRPGASPVGAECAHALGLRVGERALDCRKGCPLLAAATDGESEGHAQEVWRELPDGRRQPLLASASAVVDSAGDVEVVHSLRDITRLKEADEAKTLFLATASHELKTPLTVIAGFAEAMLAFPTMPAHRRSEALQAIHGRAVELGSIVDRLLLSSKLEGGRVKVDLHGLDLRALLAERSKAVQDSTGRHVVMQLATGSLVVAADAQALRTVVDHLLDNAIKYSDGGPVVLGARSTGGTVALWVSDIGIGMDEEQAGHCFEKFWQAESTDVRRFGGTGIGLYIVQSLVEAMAGTVTVETEIGRGSTFTVHLAADAVEGPEEGDEDDLIRQIGVLSRGSA
jgi:NtrC-family two-component system sensor histidine kinase KinB